jgi:hypothetical protein
VSNLQVSLLTKLTKDTKLTKGFLLAQKLNRNGETPPGRLSSLDQFRQRVLADKHLPVTGLAEVNAPGFYPAIDEA